MGIMTRALGPPSTVVTESPNVTGLILAACARLGDPCRLEVVATVEVAAEFFGNERHRFFGLAYRLLGSASDADDVLQDAFLRWAGTDRTSIKEPAAWLTTVVTNLCLNRLASARQKREHYVGTWLPEPVLTSDGSLGPLETAEQRDSVSLALLVLLEQLTPPERAVFVLHESFGYRHQEIAHVLGLTEAHSRQLLRRARQRVAAHRPPARPIPKEWQDLVESFFAAATAGDVERLERLLAEDVAYFGDGGGKAPVARHPVLGRYRVAHFFAKVFPRYLADPGYRDGVELMVSEVNGEPGILAWSNGVLAAVLMADVAEHHIVGLRVMMNPDKLGFVARQVAGLPRLEVLGWPGKTGDPVGAEQR